MRYHRPTKLQVCSSIILSFVGVSSRHFSAVGKNHSLFLTDKGQVLACGDNKCGQIGKKAGGMVKKPELVTYDGPPACRVACGQEFSGIVDVQGNVYMFGSPDK